MHYTIFDTPVVRTLCRWLSVATLRLLGWRLDGDFPRLQKYVLIGAPHTSNWDFPLTLMFCFANRARIYWMGKHTLFRGPFGPLMRWLGGVAVDRRQNNSLVEQMVTEFRQRDTLVLAVPPEGTRGRVAEWKSGFYYIAQGAGVPIALAYLDYPNKRGGILALYQPSGDVAADLPQIRAFYRNITGKHPHKQ